MESMSERLDETFLENRYTYNWTKTGRPAEGYYFVQGLAAIRILSKHPETLREMSKLSLTSIDECIEIATVKDLRAAELHALLVLSEMKSLTPKTAMLLVPQNDAFLNRGIPHASEETLSNVKNLTHRFLEFQVDGLDINLYSYKKLRRVISTFRDEICKQYGHDLFIEVTEAWRKNCSSKSISEYFLLLQKWDRLEHFPVDWAIHLLRNEE